jgi:hypothetical protein
MCAMPNAQQLHPATAQLLRYFEYKHLPPRLQMVSALFYGLAHEVVGIPGLEVPELTVGLRRLLEAKDCAVRAALPAPSDSTPA